MSSTQSTLQPKEPNADLSPNYLSALRSIATNIANPIIKKPKSSATVECINQKTNQESVNTSTARINALRTAYAALSATKNALSSFSIAEDELAYYEPSDFAQSLFITDETDWRAEPQRRPIAPVNETSCIEYKSGAIITVREIDNQLVQAVYDCQIKQVAQLLAAGANPNNLGFEDMERRLGTALAIACVPGCGDPVGFEGKKLRRARLPIIRMLAAAGAKDLSGTGWSGIPSPEQLLMGNKVLIQLLKALGIHPRTAALKQSIFNVDCFPKDLAALIFAYIPHQEDISDAILQCEFSIAEYLNNPAFDPNALCLNNETPLYTALLIDLSDRSFYTKESTKNLVSGLVKMGANPLIKGASGKTPIDLLRIARENLSQCIHEYAATKNLNIRLPSSHHFEYYDTMLTALGAPEPKKLDANGSKSCCVIS